MPKITHPKVGGSAVVSDRTLPFWLSHGWQIDGEQDTGWALVFARSKTDATKAARAAGLAPQEWRFIDTPDDLDTTPGSPGQAVVVTEGFAEHREYSAIHAAAVAAGFTDLSPTNPGGD